MKLRELLNDLSLCSAYGDEHSAIILKKEILENLDNIQKN